MCDTYIEFCLATKASRHHKREALKCVYSGVWCHVTTWRVVIACRYSLHEQVRRMDGVSVCCTPSSAVGNTDRAFLSSGKWAFKWQFCHPVTLQRLSKTINRIIPSENLKYVWFCTWDIQPILRHEKEWWCSYLTSLWRQPTLEGSLFPHHSTPIKEIHGILSTF